MEKETAIAEVLVLEYELDSPPEKVWRAVSTPALRERWLPDLDLAEAEPVSAVQGSEISYRMRDGAPPHRESVVTFGIRTNGTGGTRFRIVQRPAAGHAGRSKMRASNTDRAGPLLMLAA